MLDSKANAAQLGWKLAGLAVLFSRQILKGFHYNFFLFLLFFIFLDVNPCLRIFHMVIILSKAGVNLIMNGTEA